MEDVLLDAEKIACAILRGDITKPGSTSCSPDWARRVAGHMMTGAYNGLEETSDNKLHISCDDCSDLEEAQEDANTLRDEIELWFTKLSEAEKTQNWEDVRNVIFSMSCMI